MSRSVGESRRIAVVAAFSNGFSVVLIGLAGFALACLLGARPDVAAALVLVCAGLLEVRGAQLVARGSDAGFRLMRAAQPLLWVTISSWSLVRAWLATDARLRSFDLGALAVDGMLDLGLPENSIRFILLACAALLVALSAALQCTLWLLYGRMARMSAQGKT